MMDSRTVNKEIRSGIRPVLRSHGFTVFTERTAWRHSGRRVDVVNFQSFNDYLAEGLGATTFSFCLNLGQYLVCVPPEDHGIKSRQGKLAPQEWECHLRLHPSRRLEQPELPRRDIWYIDPRGAYLEAVVRDARAVIVDVGLSWFDRYSNDDLLIHELLSLAGDGADGTYLGGTLGSPARAFLLGYLSLARGNRSDARKYLSSALEQNLASSRALTSKRSKYQPRSWDRLAKDVALLDLGV